MAILLSTIPFIEDDRWLIYYAEKTSIINVRKHQAFHQLEPHALPQHN